MTAPADVARRAVTLQAIGHDRLALGLLEPGFTDPTLGLELAVGMAQVLLADPDAATAPLVLDRAMPPVCARIAFPVITEVITLTRGDHLGGLHQIWHRLDEHVRTDVLAALLALTGQAIRHPERN